MRQSIPDGIRRKDLLIALRVEDARRRSGLFATGELHNRFITHRGIVEMLRRKNARRYSDPFAHQLDNDELLWVQELPNDVEEEDAEEVVLDGGVRLFGISFG